MSISSALFSGVSGLNTLGNSMSVIGDNIANVNTIGFKSSRTTFETLLAQNITGASGTSQVGRGVAMSAVDAVFAQGSFENTSEPTDMAIGGKGFFMVRSTETGMYYTRAGHFRFDESGYLVNSAGMRVQGWILDPNSVDPQGAITDIQINATSSSPNATSEIDIAVNLDSQADFQQTPATVMSDPETQSGFIFEDGSNDGIVASTGLTGAIDLITDGYFVEGKVYSGEQVAQGIQQALNDNRIGGNTAAYSVTYDSATNTFTITNPAANATALNITGATSTIEELLGQTAGANIVVAALGGTWTGSEVAYNIRTGVNDAFSVSVDGQSVNVVLDQNLYTIPELRLELETKINDALSSAGYTATVDVRYDYSNNQFMIMSSSRDSNSSIQLSAGTNNFLPTINMTDYTLHTGDDSNGYSLL